MIVNCTVEQLRWMTLSSSPSNLDFIVERCRLDGRTWAKTRRMWVLILKCRHDFRTCTRVFCPVLVWWPKWWAPPDPAERVAHPSIWNQDEWLDGGTDQHLGDANAFWLEWKVPSCSSKLCAPRDFRAWARYAFLWFVVANKGWKRLSPYPCNTKMGNFSPSKNGVCTVK